MEELRQDKIEEVVKHLQDLTPEERVEVFNCFCVDCGKYEKDEIFKCNCGLQE